MNIITQVRQQLKKNIDLHTKKTAQRFFKEKIKYHGVKTSIVTKIANETFKEIKNLPKEGIFKLCEEMLKSGYIEESFVAFKWAEKIKDNEPRDFRVLAKWLRDYVDNWASCDTLCNHALCNVIKKFPEHISHLILWTTPKCKNRWLRRGAAVTLVPLARKGKYLNEVFKISQGLMLDEDDLVQKGYGWLLKEASRKHQKEVFDFVIKHKKVMPRTALRYAIEKMPEGLRKKAMEK